MLNPVVSSSSLSDASQVRYQKALREINKLIGVNNSVKREADHYRMACENLQTQNKGLIQRLEVASKEKRSYDQLIKNYQMRVEQMQSMNENFRVKQNTSFSASMVEKQRSKHLQQVAILNQKLTQQGNTIINLQENVAQLQKDNKNMKLSYEKSIDELKRQLEDSYKRVSYNECERCPQYKRKMNECIEFGKVLQRQIIDMKKGIYYPVNPPRLQTSRNQKDKLIDNLSQRVRITQEREKRRNIEVCKLREKLEKVGRELERCKANQILLETTAIQKQNILLI